MVQLVPKCKSQNQIGTVVPGRCACLVERSTRSRIPGRDWTRPACAKA